MTIKKKSNSLVILANNHNPTVLIGDFLTQSGMIDKSDIIDGKNSVITPGFARVRLKNGGSIQITDNQLVIQGTWGDAPFKMGKRYCMSLPHIPYYGIGINFIYKLEDYLPEDLIPDCKLKQNGIKSISTAFQHAMGVCNVQFNVIDQEKRETELKFNFDYKVPKDKVMKLGELHIDLEEERIRDIDSTKKFVKNIIS